MIIEFKSSILKTGLYSLLYNEFDFVYTEYIHGWYWQKDAKKKNKLDTFENYKIKKYSDFY